MGTQDRTGTEAEREEERLVGSPGIEGRTGTRGRRGIVEGQDECTRGGRDSALGTPGRAAPRDSRETRELETGRDMEE